MSTVMRPRRPLPQRVYWVRRILALLAVVLVITLVWWLAGRLLGNADGSEGASDKTPPATETPTDDAPTTDSGSDDRGNGNGNGDGNGDGNGKPGRGTQSRPLTSSGPCDPADVAMAVAVDDAPAGAANPITLKFRSLLSTACTLSITPSTLALRITSGDDVIWSSDNCPDELEASQVVVQPRQPLSTYEFVWNGHRSTDECAVAGRVAVAGGYWAEAALIGADAHKAYFDLR